MAPWYPHLAEVCKADKLHKTLSHRRAQPYDDRELEWLEAFLKVCDFMMGKRDTMTGATD